MPNDGKSIGVVRTVYESEECDLCNLQTPRGRLAWQILALGFPNKAGDLYCNDCYNYLFSCCGLAQLGFPDSLDRPEQMSFTEWIIHPPLSNFDFTADGILLSRLYPAKAELDRYRALMAAIEVKEKDSVIMGVDFGLGSDPSREAMVRVMTDFTAFSLKQP